MLVMKPRGTGEYAGRVVSFAVWWLPIILYLFTLPDWGHCDILIYRARAEMDEAPNRHHACNY